MAGFLTLGTSLSQGNSEKPIGVTSRVSFANGDSPLEIVGFRLPDRIGGEPRLVLRNNSNKLIDQFQVSSKAWNEEPSADVKDGCVDRSVQCIGARRVVRAIPPHEVREMRKGEMVSVHLAGLGYRANASCVSVVVGITEVSFADGSDWKPPSQYWFLRKPTHDSNMGSCEHSAAVEAALKDWDGRAAYVNSGTPSRQKQQVVDFYTVTCTFRMVEGKLTAMCPW